MTAKVMARKAFRSVTTARTMMATVLSMPRMRAASQPKMSLKERDVLTTSIMMATAGSTPMIRIVRSMATNEASTPVTTVTMAATTTPTAI